MIALEPALLALWDVELRGRTRALRERLEKGAALDEILPAPEPRGGSVEWVRARLWGTNLGASWLGGVDQPRQDGADLVLGTASFGWPDPTACPLTGATTIINMQITGIMPVSRKTLTRLNAGAVIY